MEDILASIRKMIAEEQNVMDDTRADRQGGLPSEETTADDEVLDLVDELPEDGMVVDENSAPADPPQPWEMPPADGVVDPAGEPAEDPLSLDTEFAIDDDNPAPAETAAAPPAGDDAAWSPMESRPLSPEPIMVGLEVLPDDEEPDEGEPDMRDFPRFLDESPQTVDEFPTLGDPDDSVVDPVTAETVDTTDDMAQTPHEEVVSMDAPQERILSPEAAVKTSAAFDALAQTLISGYDGDANTLEGVVRAMLKPLLKEWLDANLPRIVEDIVQTEIRRLAR